MSGYVLATFAIYENPRDFPGEFVVRRWAAVGGEAVRRLLPPGLYCLGREPGDDPCIVEVWI